MRKLFLLLLLATLFAAPLQAQMLDDKLLEERRLPHLEKRYTVSTEPFWWFQCALKFGFEMRIKNTPSWLQISPSIHILQGSSIANEKVMLPMSEDEFNFMFGYGLDINYKYFFNKRESFYVSGGGSFTHYNIKSYENYWNTYIENGLKYHTPEKGVIWQEINKIGLNAYLGYQIPNRRGFLCDIFAGLGYRHSFYSNPLVQKFDRMMWSPGYSGMVFISGIRFGVKFK